MPAAALAIGPAQAATITAHPPPPAMPPLTHAPRPRMPRLAAMTMPTISAASSTSRKTMIAVASMRGLLHHDDAAVLRIEVVKELVAAGVQRADIEADRAAGRDHLLAPHLMAFEFGRGRLLVADLQLHLGAGRHRDFGRHKLPVPDRDRHRRRIGRLNGTEPSDDE